MALSAFSGPLGSYGGSMATTGEYNGDRGPAFFDIGYMLADPRIPFNYAPGQREGNPVGGWFGCDYLVMDATPSALSAVNIAAAAVPVANTPMTLVSASGAGITVGTSITNSKTNAIVTGLLAIDGAMVPIKFGDIGTIQVWDPTKAIARNVRITSVGNDSTATFTVAGYDLYGFPMTETITGANAGIASGKKAWKYIASVTPAGTLSGSNASVGTGDVYGLPLRADRFGNTQIWWADAALTSNTGFLAAVTTTASATTGDVRGTYAVQSASDGTKTIQMRITVTPTNMQPLSVAPFSTAGLTGVVQF